MRTHPQPAARGTSAFTLIELLLVITIIVLLVGLTVGVAGYANQKAARSRAETEIKALSAALENYKADNGIYPRDPTTNNKTTDDLDARTSANPSSYAASSKFLYNQLTGQDTGKYDYPPATPTAGGGGKIYFEFKPNMLGGKDSNGKFAAGVTSINDPYGYSYGYSTAYVAEAERKQAATPPDTTPVTKGYNPTFDLWSTAGKTSSSTDAATLDKAVRPQWLTNW